MSSLTHKRLYADPDMDRYARRYFKRILDRQMRGEQSK